MLSRKIVFGLIVIVVLLIAFFAKSIATKEQTNEKPVVKTKQEEMFVQSEMRAGSEYDAETMREVLSLVMQIDKAFNDKKYGKACELSEKVIEKYGEYSWLGNARGVWYSSWGDALKNLAELSGGEGAAEKYKQACDKYAKAIVIKPDHHEALNDWGLALFEWGNLSGVEKSETKYRDACDKFSRAIKLKPDYHEAFESWGVTLSRWAELPEVEDAEGKYRQACDKYAKTIKLEPDYYEALYNWGITLYGWAKLPEVEDVEIKYRDACDKYSKVVQLKPDYHEAYNNWGVVLGAWANLPEVESSEEKLKLACEKFGNALNIKPDSLEAIGNLGSALMFLAKTETGKEKDKLLNEAIEKLIIVDKAMEGSKAYFLGCAYALKGDKEKCRQWLEVGQTEGMLPAREHAMSDDDLVSVRDEDWFNRLKW